MLLRRFEGNAGGIPGNFVKGEIKSPPRHIANFK
ncbi:MAG: hypothetical protein UV01_C0018G0014 [Parcubacteria group bacterium GW2011_GWA2_42_14]|nr:MAG: hypothetical protein UV01_C0018G0014 [Parcubacteria group bacterium GW2011_GWA2_42_14]